MKSIPQKFLAQFSAKVPTKEGRAMGLINLQEPYGYSYLVPLDEVFYNNPAFAIPSVTAENLSESIAAQSNPVFKNIRPTWIAPVLKIVEAAGGGVFFDVGAFVGSVTIHLATRQDHSILKIIAFEPNPANREILELNLTLNRLEEVVEIETSACSSVEGMRVFTINPTSAIGGKLSSEVKPGMISHNVRTTTVDSCFKNVECPDNAPLIIKIDTEGHEWDVLKGIEKAWTHLLCCIIEYWPSISLTYEEYLLNRFHVLETKSTMFSEPLPYREFNSAESLKRYGKEAIERSGNTDILLIPKAGGHAMSSQLLKEIRCPE